MHLIKNTPLQPTAAHPSGMPCREGSASARSSSWLSASTLNQLIDVLDVQVIGLSECLIGQGFDLDLNECDTPSFHYVQEGSGRMYIRNEPPVDIGPHTLIIVPPKCPFKFELTPVENMIAIEDEADRLKENKETAFMICGMFRTLYGTGRDLFDTLSLPVVEKFAPGDAMEQKLKLALNELIARNVCSDVMVTSVMKQVVVSLIRRAFLSCSAWVRRFSVLGDPHIAIALSEMQSNPARDHTIESLSSTAGMSRSTFMARFTNAVGQPPMLVLHDLRIQMAATHLASSAIPIASIAQQAHYKSAGSFARAFKKVFGVEPVEYRKTHSHIETAQ